MARPGLEPTRGSGTITIVDGLIESVTTADEKGSGSPAHARDMLAMPALGNGHDHGRGVKFLSFGVKDDTLEAWVPAFYARPDADPYLNAAAIMARFAKSGIASAVHCHTTPKDDAFESEIAAVVKAAQDVGIRIGLAVPMRDRNRFCYGEDESLLSRLNPDDRAEVARNYGYSFLSPKEQVARVEHLGRTYDSDLVQIQFAPVGVQWASDELLELIAEASARTGRRVHMHFLESRYQREWMDATYRSGVVSFLDQDRTVVAAIDPCARRMAHAGRTGRAGRTRCDRFAQHVIQSSPRVRHRAGAGHARQGNSRSRLGSTAWHWTTMTMRCGRCGSPMCCIEALAS